MKWNVMLPPPPPRANDVYTYMNAPLQRNWRKKTRQNWNGKKVLIIRSNLRVVHAYDTFEDTTIAIKMRKSFFFLLAGWNFASFPVSYWLIAINGIILKFCWNWMVCLSQFVDIFHFAPHKYYENRRKGNTILELKYIIYNAICFILAAAILPLHFFDYH